MQDNSNTPQGQPAPKVKPESPIIAAGGKVPLQQAIQMFNGDHNAALGNILNSGTPQ